MPILLSKPSHMWFIFETSKHRESKHASEESDAEGGGGTAAGDDD